MGSNRLPGKVMLPLNGAPVLEHDIRRAQTPELIDTVVVATSFHSRDDIVASHTKHAGAEVYRGSEDDVLGRMHGAAEMYDADIVVRLTGDNPFVEPRLIAAAVEQIESGLDYASNKIERTWPIGVDAEAFSFESFDEIETAANEPHHREHVTPYYHEHADEFDMSNITLNDVYGDQQFETGPDLRLTLDEYEDYDLYRKVYREVEYDEIIKVPDVVEYIKKNDLERANQNVDQKTLW